MKTNVLKLVFATVATLGIIISTVQANDDLKKAETISKNFGLITLEEATAKALAAKPGVVTDTDLEDRDFSKGWDYEFEIVDADGNEWEVYIDAKTGNVRKVSREWF